MQDREENLKHMQNYAMGAEVADLSPCLNICTMSGTDLGLPRPGRRERPREPHPQPAAEGSLS
eukprot:2021658-Rhodomonas_salina.1